MSKLFRLSVPAILSVLALSAVIPAALAAAPAITLGASSAARGTTLTINGTHFSNNEVVHITITGHTGNIETATITASGSSFSGSFTVPSDATVGVDTVTATGSSNTATASLTVTLTNQAALIVTGLPSSATYQQASITAGTAGGSGSGAVTFSASGSTACSIDS